MNFDYQEIEGFDVSHYQDDNSTPQGIDFNEMKSYGAKFVIIKAGQFYRADSDFQYNWAEAKKAGLPRSAYWFGDYYADPKLEALAFWNLVKNDPAEGMYFIDYETLGWTDWHKLYDFIVEFQRLSQLPNDKIGIYTGYFYWLEHSPSVLQSVAWFGQYPLWLAWYASSPAFVRIPFPWSELLLWQDGTPAIGDITGVESREIDRDKFNGGVEKFNKYLGGELVEPPTGEPMTITLEADLIYGQLSRLRDAPSLAGTVLLTMTGPQHIQGVGEKIQADGYYWIQTVSPHAGYVALTTSYTNVVYTPPAVPTTHLIEVYVDGVLEWSKEF